MPLLAWGEPMSWFSIKLVTCMLSLNLIAAFPHDALHLWHITKEIGRGHGKGWQHGLWCSLKANQQWTTQSTHKFNSEVMSALGHWLIDVNEATHSSGNETLLKTLCNQTDCNVQNVLYRDVWYQMCNLLKE